MMIKSSILRKMKRDGLFEEKPSLPKIKISPDVHDHEMEKKDEEVSQKSGSSGESNHKEVGLTYSRKTHSKRSRNHHKRRRKSSEKERLKVTVGKRKKKLSSRRSRKKKKKKEKKKKDYLGFEDISDDSDDMPKVSSTRNMVKVRKKKRSRIQFE